LIELLIAQASDTQVSGAWVLELVVKIFTGLGVLFAAMWAAYKRGQTTSEVTLKQPVPEVTTRQAPEFADQRLLTEHKERTDERFADIAQDIDQIHTRINALFKVVNLMEGQLGGLNENVSRLLDKAMGLPPGTTATRQRKSDG